MEVDVWYREVRRGEVVFVCRAADDTNEVIPSWMFEASASSVVLGPPRVSVAALEQLWAVLAEQDSDRGGAAGERREVHMRVKHPTPCRALVLQVPLPLSLVTKPELDARRHHDAIVAALARLLLEAALPPESEASDDTP